MPNPILIIDDDVKLIQLLDDYFRTFGFGIKLCSATNAQEGLDQIKRCDPSLIILDIMLPGKNGLDLCREIRQSSQVPIIMLTARGEITDRVVGLELGADDYLPKPFDPRELVARIQSVLRRTRETPTAETVVFKGLEIDFRRRIVRLDGVEIDLSTTEFETLKVFTQHPGQVLSRDQLMDKMRGVEWAAFDRSIDVLVSRLRQKLGDDPKNPRFFKTVWGAGYAFVGELERKKAG
jgi:two-component system phosphate regulon response regulator OmpR